MKRFLFSTKKFNTDATLLLLRILFGGLMLFDHGLSKIEKLQHAPVQFMDFIGLGPEKSLWLVVFAEAFCSALLLVGLATRLALIPLIINMLVASYVVLKDQPFSKGELAIIFLGVYMILLISGPGKYSIDRIIE